MGAHLALGRVEKIIEQEIRKVGRVEGHDLDDLRQLAKWKVATIRERVVESESCSGARYYRTAIRNMLINEKRQTQTFGRLPHDQYGRRLYPTSADAPRTEGEEGSSVLLSTPDLSMMGLDPEAATIMVDLLRKTPREELRARLVAAITSDTRRKRGPLARAHERAMNILTELFHRVDGGARHNQREVSTMVNAAANIPVPTAPPECHAIGKEPLGYDPKELECRFVCKDKFSCFVMAMEKKLIKVAPDVDHEINVVRAGIVPIENVIKRMKERQKLIRDFQKEKGEDAEVDTATLIPAELAIDALFPEEGAAVVKPKRKTNKEKNAEKQPTLPLASDAKGEQDAGSSKPADEEHPKDAAASSDNASSSGAGTDEDAQATDTTTTDDKENETMKTKNKGKKGKAAKAPPPPKTPPKAKATAKKGGTKTTKKKATGAAVPRKRAEVKKVDGRTMVCNRKLPEPTDGLTAEKMAKSLKRIKIGTPFPIDIGMTLTKHMRDGDLSVTVEKNGYRLAKNKKLYSSLSGAVMNATNRLASCNEFFNVEKNRNITVTGKGVPKGKFSSQAAD